MDTAAKPTGPTVVEDLVILKPDKQVEIGRGEFAPLGSLIACRDPHCNVCTEGWVRVVTGPRRVRNDVCGCCVARFRRRREAARRAEAESEAVVVASPGAALQKARLDRRLSRLTDEVTALEAKIAHCESLLAGDIASLEREARRHEAAAQDHTTIAAKARSDAHKLEEEIREAETRLADLRLRRQGKLAAADADEQAVELATALQQDIDERITQRRAELADDTRGLRRDLEKAKRRLATARGYNMEVLGG